MTLIELVVTLLILVVGMLGFSQVILSSLVTSDSNREVTHATEFARRVLEELQASDFDEVFASFNGDAQDDPGGMGTAPGNDFDVPGLQALEGDADGLAGEIVFPSPPGIPGQLREDIVDASLGTPRDLNADGNIDGADHSADYELLPVLVRVRWRGPSGPSRMELRTVLSAY